MTVEAKPSTTAPPRRLFRAGLAMALAPLIMLCAGAPAQNALRPDEPFQHDAWMQAPRGQAEWSREAMAMPLVTGAMLDGMAREKVLALLGEPGMTRQEFDTGIRGRGRSDTYRLSLKNDRVLRIGYDAGDVVIGHVLDSSPCICDTCDATAPVISLKALNNGILARGGLALGVQPTIAQFEALVGTPGRRSGVEQMTGGQMWLNFADTWRVTEADRQFLSAFGHVATGQGRGTQSIPLDTDPIYVYSLITQAAECLAR